MAASISEAIEAGAELLLIDEDTSATNLLYKDEIMARIIRREPITPLSSLARSMIQKTGISMIAVAGASSSLIHPAGEVILMEGYKPSRITDEAKRHVAGIRHASEAEYSPPRHRIFYGIRGLKKVKTSGFKIVARYDDGTAFELDLSRYPRIVEKGQVNLIARALMTLRRPSKPMHTSELAKHLNSLLEEKGFRALAHPVPPDLTIVSGIDVIWALNRIHNAIFEIG